MLGASANGLHRGPHVFLRLDQVPASRQKLVSFDAAALVDSGKIAGHAVPHRLAPGDVAITLHYRMGLAALQYLLRKQGGMNAAIDDPGAPLARHATYVVPAKGVAGVHA